MKKLSCIAFLALAACTPLSPQERQERENLFLECVNRGVNSTHQFNDNAKVIETCQTASAQLVRNW